MALNNMQYDVIKRRYDEKRRLADRDRDSRIAYVNEHVDGYKELSDAISSLSIEHTKRALSGDKDALTELNTLIEDLRQQKAALLLGASLPANYLDVTYECPDCKDTGYIDGKKCHCFKQQMLTFLYDQSNIKDNLADIGFEMVSDSYYSGDDLKLFKDTYKKTINFADNFDSDYQNLLFYGTVGTGKSLLSSCVAKQLLESGHSVIYFSATALMDTLSKDAFDYKNRNSNSLDDLFNCDLLIIDDLGTEMTNNFTVSSLFSLLNERFLRRKSIVISTNLSLEELRNRYTDRIFSRLMGQFTFCRLSGPDIRIKHKFEQSQ